MLFNSFNYALFFPIIFILYWFVFAKNLRNQNLLLLVSSCFFYACWDWRFLFLLLFSIVLDYVTGIKISASTTNVSKKIWLWISIVINVGFLGLFKYYNFFIASFEDFLGLFNLKVNIWTLRVILPVGISFYTFHGLSYVIDIYYDRIKAEKNFVDYAVFVSFFPLLVAGPIERATHLLPQIKTKRTFSYPKAINGLKQILWGLFKKVVIADQCAEVANVIFSAPEQYSGSTLLLGAVFFAFQIYGDFSGYSDIALGSARLLGIELLQNFSFPYFSRNIAEFWRRWHISLSSWFRDYLYIPLGGSKVGLTKKIRNTLIIFLVSGFWHGANWTFIIWGLLNALYILPSIILKTNRTNLDIVAQGKLLPSFREFFAMNVTFSLTVIAWVFFRSESVESAFVFISGIFSPSLFTVPSLLPKTVLVLLVFFLVVEWLGRQNKFAIETLGIHWNRPLRLALYYVLFFMVIYFSGSEQQFIYFQF